ncbi:MAG: hypothetical protein AAF514_15880 [Verrucomicrobiota bacterium]
MKRLMPVVAIGVTLLLCAGAYWYQSQQLMDLRSCVRTIREENRQLTASLAVPDRGKESRSALPFELTGDPGRDAEAFLKAYDSLATGAEERDAPEGLLSLIGWLDRGPVEVLRALVRKLESGSRDNPKREGLVQGVLLVLGRTDPRFALDWLVEHDRGSVSVKTLEGVLSSWHQEDSEAAFKWAVGLVGGSKASISPATAEERRLLIRGVGRGLARGNPRAVVQLAAAIAEDSGLTEELLRHAAEAVDTDHGWLDLVRASMTTWESTPGDQDDGFRERALEAITSGIRGNGALTEFRDLVDRVALPPDEKNRFLTESVLRAFDDQTGERMDWLIDRSSPDRLQGNVQRVMSSWASKDFNAAARWLGTLDSSGVRDAAVVSFCQVIAGFEPDSALAWAATVADPDLRSRTEALIQEEKR